MLARWTLAALGSVLLAVAVVLMLLAGTRGAEVANVLALPVALVGVLLAWIGVRSRSRATDPGALAGHARELARRVAEQEARTRQRLLGDTGDARPADVRFGGPAVELVRWRPDGAGTEGSLDTIADFYRRLPRGRLVVLGEPGSGKTVLVIELLVRLADELLHNSDDAGIRVPVRLSLPAFLPTGHDVATPDAVRRRLDEWIVDQLKASYGLRGKVATELVARGMVLPILDALDEMDAEGAEPARARAVVAALNLPAGPGLRPVVITCRTGRYAELAEPAVPHVVQDASVVVMQPLSVEQISRWLAHRFPDAGATGDLSDRWQPVLARIRRHPTGRLATCLASPLRLYLAVTAYQDPRSSPRELLVVPAADLDAHLLAKLVPATTTHCPRPDGGHYEADDVTRWLRTFASHLDRMAASGGSGTDLHLHELWRSTGDRYPGRAVRWLSAVTAAVLTALPASVLVFAVANTVPTTEGDVLTVALGAVLAGFAGLLAARPRLHPSRLDLRWLRARAGRRRSWVSLTAALVLGGMVAVEYGWVVGAPVAAVVMIMLLGLDASSRPVTIEHPSQVVTQGVAREVMVALFSITGMIMLWMVITVTLLGTGLVLVGGAILGLTFGLLSVCFLMAGSPWPRYAIAVFALRRGRQLPPRPARFADWAYTAGLLRLSGTAIQFRHREFQLSVTTTGVGSDEFATREKSTPP